MPRSSRTPLMLALSCLFAGIITVGAGCAVEPEESSTPDRTDDPNPELQEQSQAILNGNVADTETLRKGGFVQLAHSVNGQLKKFCSGTLISNTRLFTARHCFEDPTTRYIQGNAPSLFVFMAHGDLGQQERRGQAIFFANSGFDYAMVDVRGGFNMPRNSDNVVATTVYTRAITIVPSGTDVLCFGNGLNSETCGADPNVCEGTGNGVLRWARLTGTVFDAGSHQMFRYKPNILFQLQARGDSGGSCVTLVPIVKQMWKQPLVSILSQCSPGSFCNSEIALTTKFDTWTKVTP